MITLSPQQKQIVNIRDGAVLVKASAGSGKTRVLTERVRKLLSLTKRKILALTFTNKAGEEIAERLSDIPDLKSRMFVGTFHSFCQSVLENHGHLIGYSQVPHIIEKESDRMRLVEEAIMQIPSFLMDFNGMNSKETGRIKYDILSHISKQKRKFVQSDSSDEGTSNVPYTLIHQNYNELLFNQNAIDFDDLLLLTYRLFAENLKIASLYRRSYEYICIDEAQDLNNAQYGVLKALTGGVHKNIMMVGDPNQSIYAFNGSSPDYMMKNFMADFTPFAIELKENYRSSKEVLKLAETIIPESCDIENTAIQGGAYLDPLPNEEAEADFIVTKISEYLSLGHVVDIEGTVTPERIAVLARNKYVFKHLEKKLKECGLSYYYKMSPGAVEFETSQMKIFHLALRIKLNPVDFLHKRELQQALEVDGAFEGGLEELCNIVIDGNHKNLLNAVISLKDDGSNLRRVLKNLKELLYIEDENERQLFYNDVDSFSEHWKHYANKTDRKSLLQFRNSMALGRTHPLTQHKGITLSTVHTMKGQEFDIVFLMGMDNETFPDYRALRAGGAELTQEKNNLYVAITRAKRFLFMTYPQQRLMPWGDYKRRWVSCFLQ